jgi:hypothetical protein
MMEYILMNRFTERYETGGGGMRSRKVRILMAESFVLKKREWEREREEEGAPMKEGRQLG